MAKFSPDYSCNPFSHLLWASMPAYSQTRDPFANLTGFKQILGALIHFENLTFNKFYFFEPVHVLPTSIELFFLLIRAFLI